MDGVILTEEVFILAEFRYTFHLTNADFALLILSDDVYSLQGVSDLPLRVWGIIPPDATMEEMVASIQALNEGLLVGTPSLLEPALTQLVVDLNAEALPLIEPLTDRETKVLQLLAYGLAKKQIAAKLHISKHTVKFHVSSIYGYLK